MLHTDSQLNKQDWGMKWTDSHSDLPPTGPVPHPDSQLGKYDWGDGVDMSSFRPGPQKARARRREQMAEEALHQMATSEMLLQEESGSVNIAHIQGTG